jgi:flagellar motor switch protein FliN/FliY
MTEDNLQARVDAALGLGPSPSHSAQGSQVAQLDGTTIDMLMDVTLQLTVELGRANMTVGQVLDLQKGSVIELNRIAGEAVDVYVNNRLLAHGDVVVVDDKFGVRITELVAPNVKKGENS